MSKVTMHPGFRAYGVSAKQEEALLARQTGNEDLMLKIANESDNRLVLMNLAMNESLGNHPEVVKALFGRGMDGLTARLERLGYSDSWF